MDFPTQQIGWKRRWVNMREIKAKTHPNVNITVKVTDEMIRDYRECYRIAMSSDFDDCKDCDECSWRGVRITSDFNACELDEMKELLEG